jgi:hypothetical protein
MQPLCLTAPVPPDRYVSKQSSTISGPMAHSMNFTQHTTTPFTQRDPFIVSPENAGRVTAAGMNNPYLQSVTSYLTARGPQLLAARWWNTLQTITAVRFQSARQAKLQLKISFNKPRVSSSVRENIHEDDKFSNYRFSTGKIKRGTPCFCRRRKDITFERGQTK